MKNHFSSFVCKILTLLFILNIQCADNKPKKTQPVSCRCPIEKVFMQMKGNIKVYDGNANEDDFKRDDVIKIEGDAEVSLDAKLKKVPSGKAGIKIAFPKGENNQKNLTIYEIKSGTPDDYTKFFYFYCMKYSNYVDTSCSIPERYKKQFDNDVTAKFNEIFSNPQKKNKNAGESYPQFQPNETKPISKILGKTCDGDDLYIKESDVHNIYNSISFVRRYNVTVDIARKNIDLICKEEDHADKEKKLLDALYYKYIIENNLQDKSEYEIKKLLDF